MWNRLVIPHHHTPLGPLSLERPAGCEPARLGVLEILFTGGDRIHGPGGGVFRQQHFRWSLQPSGPGQHLRFGAVILAEYLNLLAG
jgi:hypothetical protein